MTIHVWIVVSAPNFHRLCLINLNILVYQQTECDCSLWKVLRFNCVFLGILIYNFQVLFVVFRLSAKFFNNNFTASASGWIFKVGVLYQRCIRVKKFVGAIPYNSQTGFTFCWFFQQKKLSNYRTDFKTRPKTLSLIVSSYRVDS